MIDDIVEMILKEARGREGGSRVFNIYRVCMETQTRIIEVLDKYLDEERRKIKDES